VADILLASLEYLQTALAHDTFGKNLTETTSLMAQRNRAVLAINGDFYGVRERGYVLRNGVLYRSTYNNNQEDLVIYEDGSFEIVKERIPSAETLLKNGARHILSFGPALVQNGEICVNKRGLSGHASTINPRTAIGIIDGLHYVFVTVDGRTGTSRGMTVYELAEFMHSLGVTTAYNLDGGGSSVMWVYDAAAGKGKVMNSVSDSKGERSCLNYMLVKVK
jgi:exopolysaccharide biosynthesis protein